MWIENGAMKTMIELPEDLAQVISARAAESGQEIADQIVEVLREALVPGNDEAACPRPRIVKDPITGLPVICCAPDAPGSKMTMEELLSLEQESLLLEDLERLGLSP